MKNNLRIVLVFFVAISINFLGMAQAAQAALIGTQEIAASSNTEEDRSLVLSTLQRQDLREQLVRYGVDPTEVEQRVASLSDQEVSRLANDIRTAPAGGASVLGVLLVIFIVLLITDILGYTKVFPFVKPMK